MTYAFRALMCTFLFLAGCVPDAPPPADMSAELPALPPHCGRARTPTPPGIKRAAPPGGTDLMAAKDRLALKGQIATLRSYRQACSDQLKVLFPSKERPTS